MFVYPRVGNVLTYPEAGSLHVAYFGHYVHSASTGLRCTLTNQLKTCREETNRASFIVLLSFSAKVPRPSLSAHTPSRCPHGHMLLTRSWAPPGTGVDGARNGTGSWNQQKSPGGFHNSLGPHALTHTHWLKMTSPCSVERNRELDHIQKKRREEGRRNWICWAFVV